MAVFVEKLLLEGLGTCALMLAVLLTANPWIVGAVLAVAIWATLHRTWGAFNPAITLVMAARGSVAWKTVPFEIAAQLGGAFAAYGLSMLIR
jgi:glycerol uptake facilitator-like aquaporin